MCEIIVGEIIFKSPCEDLEFLAFSKDPLGRRSHPRLAGSAARTRTSTPRSTSRPAGGGVRRPCLRSAERRDAATPARARSARAATLPASAKETLLRRRGRSGALSFRSRQIGGRLGVSAAGLQSRGLHRRRVFFADAGGHPAAAHLPLGRPARRTPCSGRVGYGNLHRVGGDQGEPLILLTACLKCVFFKSGE